MLAAQIQASSPISELISWIESNLTEPLNVKQLADRVAMSERNFYRHFVRLLGTTPARMVETLRLDQARNLLTSDVPIKRVAERTGFSNAAQLTIAFERRFGMRINDYLTNNHRQDSV
jgi:transcriptional regulator GlxA family with amidase domain